MSDPFQFKVPNIRQKHGAGRFSGAKFPLRQEQDPEPPSTIHGIPIGSVEEWRWAVACDFYKVDFDYQVDVSGGRAVSGGSVLDFLLYTAPLWTPVNIKGLYWHSGLNALEDEIRSSRLRSYFGGKVTEYVDVFTWQIPTIASAKALFRELITL